MNRFKISEPTRTLLYSIALLALVAITATFVAKYEKTEAAGVIKNDVVATPAATFPANAGTLGPIPDAPTAGPQAPGTPLNVTFTASGLTGAPSNVELSMTFSPVHTFRGDLVATLIAPNSTSFVLFGYTGATTATSFGSGNDLAGPYNFRDAAAGTNWWTVAATPTTAGDYRTTVSGPTTNPAAVTNLTAAFAGVSNPNGTWTLRITDGASGDTGSISAATLTIATAAPAQHVIDMNGDGKTDFSVVRNTGGGPTGQVTWFTAINGPGGGLQAPAWGIATDFFIPADYDGDGKTDVAVFRSAATGTFYILQSQTNTVRQEDFGQTGDDPTVVGDYSGDGKADLAVYRAGATAGAQSTWFYRSTAGGAVNYVPWGQNGDFPAPGDYDGDGKYDFTVQRNAGGGAAGFWTRLATGATPAVVIFGTPTDVIVPGDYDGDGKTDIATVRGSGGSILWFVRRSSDSAITGFTWGSSATDFPAQGDYDGDGKVEPAIWRPSATPGQSAFWALPASGTPVGVAWGLNGDYPVANFNAH